MDYEKEEQWQEYKFNHSYSGIMKLEKTDEEIKRDNWYLYENEHNPKWKEYKDRHGAPLIDIRVIEGTNLLTNGRDTFKPSDLLLDYFWYEYKANHGHTENRETKTLEEWAKDSTGEKTKSLVDQFIDCLNTHKKRINYWSKNDT